MKFDWRATLVLAGDAQITEARVLPPDIRREIAAAGGEYLVHRPRTRSSTKAIDGDALRFVESFRTPRVIVDAVIALARATDTPPEQLLEECFPLLRSLVGAGLLVVVGADDAAQLRPLLETGARLGRWCIDECVRLIDDSEIYRAHDGETLAAIKRVRLRGLDEDVGYLLRREASVLERLDGIVTPRLLEAALDDALPWIAITWHDGVRPDELRDPDEAVAVCLALVDAYVHLHGQGVLHGDVHPGNVVVGDDGRMHLLDLALARVLDADDDAVDVRGGVQGYWEPEYAEAMMRGRAALPVTARGEQYSIATLIDTVLAGESAIRMPAVASGQWRAIVDGDRQSFGERGRKPWPAVEAVLRRAMAREPEYRFADVASFAAALRAATAHAPALLSADTDPVRAALEALGPGGVLFEQGIVTAPRSSFNFGAAGIAFGLYRMARARDDAELLAVAHVWQARAEEALQLPEGLHDAAEFRADDLGDISPYHAESGVWLTRALLASAASSPMEFDAAARRYVASVERATSVNLDLTLGKSSALVGAAVLYGVRPVPALRKLGDGLMKAIWDSLSEQPPIADSDIPYLGIAHGWAGFVYAALLWAKVTASPAPAHAWERFAQLCELSRPNGTALRVPVNTPANGGARAAVTMDGWCHGQAGHAFLHLLAASVTGDTQHIERAARIGESAFLGNEDLGNLCCGLAGRAYAMIALGRATGDRVWLDRARELAHRAGAGPAIDRWPNSLYKGRVGLAVLGAELEHPALAAMPLFEEEGWMSQAATL